MHSTPYIKYLINIVYPSEIVKSCIAAWFIFFGFSCKIFIMNIAKLIGVAVLAMAFLGCRAARVGAKQSPAEAAEKS